MTPMSVTPQTGLLFPVGTLQEKEAPDTIRLLSAGRLPTVYGWTRSLLPYTSSSDRNTYSLNQNN